jgi:hypothetical protein
VAQLDVGFDYLQLLDLEPSVVPAMGTRGLREVIKKKKQEWTSKAINPLYQQEARWNLERIRQFEGLLDQPDALEAYVNQLEEVRATQREQQEHDIRKLVALAATGKKVLSPRQRELLKKEARAQKVPESLVEEVIRSLGIRVPSDARAAPAKPALPYRKPAMDRVVLTEIHNWLRILDQPTLYSLLDAPAHTSAERLVSLAKIIHAKWSKVLPKTTACTAWEKTAQACITYLKDEHAKERYDNALFNRRLDQFVQRVDLVLAAAAVGREEQVLLARLGVEDFGLSSEEVEACVAARAAEKGVIIERPAHVAVQVDAQVQCQSCFAWNEALVHKHCRSCGAALRRRCENGACRASLPVNARVCSKCKLRVFRGKQYAALLDLADVLLNRGSVRTAIATCQLARQILPSAEVDQRLDRAEKIRALTTALRASAARKAWSRAENEMLQLLKLAPQIPLAGIPDLNRISDFMAQNRDRLHLALSDDNPVAAAKICLTCLAQWQDCEEAAQRARHLVQVLESQQRYRAAWQVARKLIELQPEDKNLPIYADRLEQEMRQAEQRLAQIEEALQAYQAAAAENRLYAAETACQVLHELGAGQAIPASAREVQRKLLEVREELQQIKRLAESVPEKDPVIARYAALVQNCHDCREALSALQNATPDPPAAAEHVQVELEGNRRRLSWDVAKAGKQPTVYVLQRSLTRAGSRQEDGPFETIYTGSARHFVDDDIVHCGTILRYAVTAVLRSKVEVNGDILREFEVASPPAAAEDLLLWQEVMNLRSTRLETALHLTWYQPSAVRQVVIERWPGGSDARQDATTPLPATGPGVLIDASVQADQLYTYRVCLVYDGPDGDFRTPGVCCTDALVTTPAREPAQRAGA